MNRSQSPPAIDHAYRQSQKLIAIDAGAGPERPPRFNAAYAGHDPLGAAVKS